MGRVTSEALLVAALAAPLLAVVALTVVGGRRRGAGWLLAVLSGVLFPLTWAVWYVRDEHPLSRYRPVR